MRVTAAMLDKASAATGGRITLAAMQRELAGEAPAHAVRDAWNYWSPITERRAAADRAL
jgi:hypothetical protein